MRHTNINTGKVRPPMDTPALELTDKQSADVQKTRFRVSLDSIKAKIEHIDYIHPARHAHMTICLVTMKNGFISLGKSTPADPDNFDPKLGQQFALEDAMRHLWVLEAYLLREIMSK